MPLPFAPLPNPAAERRHAHDRWNPERETLEPAAAGARQAAGRRRFQGIMCLHDSEGRGARHRAQTSNEPLFTPASEARSEKNVSGRVRMYGLHRFARQRVM